MGRLVRWLGTVVLLAAASLASGLAEPAWACGCGAYIPDRAGASVAGERALIAWDGTDEDIVMSFDVSGRSDSAAWVMPVPSAARVGLGDPATFDALGELTKPRTEYRDDWWPAFDWLGTDTRAETAVGAPPGGVNVLARQRIGPFDVAQLAADDPSALANWLSEYGFRSSNDLAGNLAPYVAERWHLVAIKLAPRDGGDELTGRLQPLTLSFRSDEPVYPMRLSRAATLPQTVDLYVLSDHRMDPTSVPVTGQPPRLEFAGRLEPAPSDPALVPYLTKGTFLTRWSNLLTRPELIAGDYVFTRTGADTSYRSVVYVTRQRGELTGVVLIGAIGLGVVLVSLAIVRRRRT